MANEISATVSLVINDGTNYKVTIQPGTIQATLTDKAAGSGVQTVGTAAEVIDLGDVGTAGWSYFRNLSSTTGEYVDIGVGSTSSFSPCIRLYPGEVSLAPMATTSLFARASTSQTNSVRVQKHIQNR